MLTGNICFHHSSIRLLFVMLELGIRTICTYLLLLILSFNLCIEPHFYAKCNLPHQSCLILHLVSSKKSLQAKLDLNEKYEQRPKFFISIEWFVVCDNGFCFSSSFYVVVVIFVVIWHRPKNVVTGRER